MHFGSKINNGKIFISIEKNEIDEGVRLIGEKEKKMK